MGRKRAKNYQNISDKSKNILMKELSYINGVDSEMTNTNKTNNIIRNNEKNNTSKQSINEHSNIKDLNENGIIKEEEKNKKEDEDNYENEFDDVDKNNENNESKKESDNQEIKNKEKEINNEINNKFSSLSNINSNSNSHKELVKPNDKKVDDIKVNLKIDDLIKNNNEQIKEELPPINPNNDKNNKEVFESGSMESDYIIDVTTIDKLKAYLLKQAEVFDDDFIYSAMHFSTRKYVPHQNLK